MVECTMTATIYKIRNKLDGKLYVGSTIDLRNRWKCHRSNLRAGIHHSRHLQCAWNKYGEINFLFIVVERCALEDRVVREQLWIDRYKAFSSKFGYNICRYAESVVGRTHSEETRKKMSAAATGKVFTPEHCQHISEAQAGRVVSDETRAKLSIAGKGRVFSAESIRKSAEARRGRKLSDASKQLIRDKAIGRKVSEETRRRLSEAGKGRMWSASQHKRMASLERTPLTDKQRARMSVARGGRSFTITTPEGTSLLFDTLVQAAKALRLDPSNIHKCLLGKARTTKGHRCEYNTPHFFRQV